MHRLRKHRHLAAAVAVALALAVAGVASAANVQNLDIGVSPSDLPKKRYKGVALTVTTHVENGSDPSALPSPTTRAKLDFDDDGKFNPRGLATCTKAALRDTTTSQALSRCGKAKVGTGKATVGAPLIGRVGATVTAFNGRPQNGKPTILFHGRGGGMTIVLSGVLIDSPLGGDFGRRLDVTVPRIASGQGAITDFKVTVKRKFTVDGKTRHYLSARCRDKNQKLNAKGSFHYRNGSPANASAFQACT